MHEADETVLRILERAGLLDVELRAKIGQIVEEDELHIIPAGVQAGLDEHAVARALADACGAPVVELAPVWAEARELVSRDLAARFKCVPLQYEGDRRLVVAFLDPSDADAMSQLAAVTRRTIEPRTMTLSTWHRLFDTLWPPDWGEVVLEATLDRDSPVDGAYRALSTLLVRAYRSERRITIRIDADVAEIEGVWRVAQMDGRYDITRAVVGRLREMAEVALGGGVGWFTLDGLDEHALVQARAEFSDDDAFTEISLEPTA